MTPEERIRWEELRKKAKKDSTVHETREYSDLISRRLVEVMRLIPVPQCCEASRDFPTVTFSVDYADNIPSDKGPGKWHVTRSTPLEEYYRDRDDPGWWGRIPEPKFCPYCGTPLPKMRRKDPPPKTVCLITDGGYYCARCKDRLDSCLCDPISFAFEPVLKKLDG